MATKQGPADPIRSKDPLLQPFELKHLTLRNRIMSTSHACGLEEGGLPKERYQAYHEEKAKGGLALTMFGGSSNVAPDSPNVFQQLNVGDDAIIPHFERFSQRIHAQGAALMCQITHLGQRADAYLDHMLPPIAPSHSRETLHRSFAREMDEHDIRRVVKAFADAAWRCKVGGLDGLETLGGGHLMGQFLSPLLNRRTDRYGGSIENRCRFPLEVYEAIRKRVGDDFIVGFRFVVDEGHAEGLGFEQSLEIARVFERSGVLDFWNAIYGRIDVAIALTIDNMPGMESPIGPWLDKAAAFKREVKLPVFHAARITDLATARHAIANGLIDMAGMTRAHIADPHLVEKLIRGEADRIRPCIGANYCRGPTRPTCIHNAATGRELKLPQRIERSATPGKKVVVVGGGPAGLEAARVAAERGHEVVLIEAGNALGGQVRLATRGSWRRDLVGIIDWRAAELERLGVEVRLNSFAEAGDIAAEAPDVVVMATGGTPDLAWLDGHEHATSAWDLIEGSVAPGDDVIVYDGTGRHTALIAAETVLAAGRTARLVTLDDHMGMDLTGPDQAVWKRRAYEIGLPMQFDLRLVRVAREGNRLQAVFVNELTGDQVVETAGQVVVEHGTVPADEVFRALRSASANDGVTDLDALIAGRPQPSSGRGGFELHRIGDAASSRNIHTAVLDGLRLACVL